MPSLLLLGGAAPSGSLTLTAVEGGLVATVEKRGGTVVELTGTGFNNSMVVDILLASSVVGAGYIFDPEFDVTATSAFVGLPVLAVGSLYDLRVTVGANTAALVGALSPQLFAEENKTHEARRNFASVWATGPRLLLNNRLDMGAL